MSLLDLFNQQNSNLYNNPYDPNNSDGSIGTPLLTFNNSTNPLQDPYGFLSQTIQQSSIANTSFKNALNVITTQGLLGSVTNGIIHGLVDTYRIFKYLYATPQGINWLILQQPLQLMGPQMETSANNIPLPLYGSTSANRVYNPLGLNTLLQIPLQAAGINTERQGILPDILSYYNLGNSYEDTSNPISSILSTLTGGYKYISTVEYNNLNGANRLIKFLNSLNDSGNGKYYYTTPGGAGSILGFGNTKILLGNGNPQKNYFFGDDPFYSYESLAGFNNNYPLNGFNGSTMQDLDSYLNDYEQPYNVIYDAPNGDITLDYVYLKNLSFNGNDYYKTIDAFNNRIRQGFSGSLYTSYDISASQLYVFGPDIPNIDTSDSIININNFVSPVKPSNLSSSPFLNSTGQYIPYNNLEDNNYNVSTYDSLGIKRDEVIQYYNKEDRLGTVTPTSADSINMIRIMKWSKFRDLSDSAQNSNSELRNDKEVFYQTIKDQRNINGYFGRDIIKFRIEYISNQDINDTSVVAFRAYLSEFSDNFNTTISEVNYIGRGESFYTPFKAARTVKVGFTILAHTNGEMAPIYNKLNFMMSNMYPEYSNNLPKGNFIKITVGDYLYRQPAVIESLSISNLVADDAGNWEIAMDEPELRANYNSNNELPKRLKVDLNIRMIHDFLPQRGDPENMLNTPFITPSKGSGGSSRNYILTPNAEKIKYTQSSNVSSTPSVDKDPVYVNGNYVPPTPGNIFPK